MTRIANLDDYQNLALEMADWSSLRNRTEIIVVDHHLSDPEATPSLGHGSQSEGIGLSPKSIWPPSPRLSVPWLAPAFHGSRKSETWMRLVRWLALATGCPS
jgi:hypothetical protein